MDPLHERQLSSSAAGPSHAPKRSNSLSGSLSSSQYGGLSFVSVRFHMSKSCSLHCHLALLMTNLMTMLLQHMLAGAIAGISEHIAMYPMDTIKTRMQALGHPGQRVQPILFSDHFASIRRALSEKVLCDCAAERVNSPSGHCSCRQKRRHSGLVRWSWCHHMGSRVGFSQAF